MSPLLGEGVGGGEFIMPMEPIYIILIVLAVALPIGLIIWLFLRAIRKINVPTQEELGERKGRYGENYIAVVLKKCMQKGDTLLNNVVLSDPRSTLSVEIDHVLLSRRGIFVVETKNRSGDIYGDDEAEQWTQYLGNGSIRHEFYSPVKQSIAHAKKVSYVTKCKAVFPLVVFAEGNTQHIVSDITFDPLGLRRFIQKQPNVLSEGELSAALTRLQDCMANSISAEEHRRNMRKKYGE